MGSTPADRAADLHAAFADPEIRAVIASIGGDDQITVLPHLDADLIRSTPKPFFGWSDNTNLLVYLYNLGLVAYHGGSVMVQFGRPGAMHPLTADSLRAALFSSGEYELLPADAYTDVGRDWADPATFEAEPEMSPTDGWVWRGPQRVVEGVLWGGNLEILSWLLMVGRDILRTGEYAGRILAIETSEEMPPAVEVYRILRNMGERGLLRQFGAVLVGRAKAWNIDRRTSAEQRAAYVHDQHDAVLRALGEYAPDAVIVLDVDFGHTDPQVVLPIGGRMRVDAPARRIVATY
jgi:muramoyltetrapeptide carboxypeptidase LdcA involved in peptidoglycan recycling